MHSTKLLLRILSLVLPILYTGFLVADRAGLWARWQGLDRAERVAERFEQSYAPNASAPVNVGDPEWEPLLRLIYKYSHASFPKDKQPQTIARFRAVISGKEEGPEGQLIGEWTAPSTPFALVYRPWPGQPIPKDDYRVVGTIGDMRAWITRSKDDLRFLVKDVIFVLFSFAVGLSLLLHEHRTAKQASSR
jgi:hypothetical protein